MMMMMTAQYVAATSAPCSVAQHAWKTQLRKIPANCTFFCNSQFFDALAISASVRNVLYQNIQLLELQRRGISKTWSFGRSDQTKLRCLSQFSLLHRNTSQAICFTNIVEPLSKYHWWSNIGGGRRRAPQRRGTQDVDLWKRPPSLGVHKQLLWGSFTVKYAMPKI